MSKVEFELNLSGLNQIMKSAEMQGVLERAGESVARNAGANYGSRVHVANFVAITNVYPENWDARRDNMANNTLVKALGSSGCAMHK